METLKLDILAFGAHPDDVELSCAGTLLKHADLGFACGVIDLTRGELGSRGTVNDRDREAANAAKIMKLTIRENLNMRDGFFVNDEAHQMKIIQCIRRFKPDYILANAIEDRHPDHARAANLIREAAFLSGLQKIETYFEGNKQQAWRPKKLLHYIQDKDIKPDILIDISGYFDQKWQAIKAYRSQFYNPESTEPNTYISTPEFLEALKGRMLNWGKYIGVQYAEGFTSYQYLGIGQLNHLY